MADQAQRALSFDWAQLFYWMMATTVGWLVGGLLLPGIALVAAGPAIGLLQALVLVKRIRKPWRWTLVTAAGWLAGWLLILVLVPPGLDSALGGIVLGFTTGIAQWLLLRRAVYWAGWWIAVSALGWMTGLTLIPGALLSAVTPAVMTGITLEILLRFPKPVEEAGDGA